MKTFINGVAITAGISGALTLNRLVTAPLAGKALAAVGILPKIPQWGQTVISDLLVAGHVVAGIAAGTAVGSAITKKVA